MNKNILLTLSGLLIILFTFINVKSLISNKPYDKESTFEYFKYLMTNTIEINGKYLTNIEVKDLTDKTHFLKAYIGNGKKIVFRYSQLNCQSCVDQEIGYVKKIIAFLGQENIIIITSYTNRKDLVNFLKVNQLSKNILLMEKNQLLYENEPNAPYLLVLDSEMKVLFSFFPDKSFPKISDIFYRLLIANFKKAKSE